MIGDQGPEGWATTTLTPAQMLAGGKMLFVTEYSRARRAEALAEWDRQPEAFKADYGKAAAVVWRAIEDAAVEDGA